MRWRLTRCHSERKCSRYLIALKAPPHVRHDLEPAGGVGGSVDVDDAADAVPTAAADDAADADAAEALEEARLAEAASRKPASPPSPAFE